jgi:hypothetical protein
MVVGCRGFKAETILSNPTRATARISAESEIVRTLCLFLISTMQKTIPADPINQQNTRTYLDPSTFTTPRRERYS